MMNKEKIEMTDFISIADCSVEQVKHFLDVAFTLREEKLAKGFNKPVLAHKTLAMIFEKPSLRTKVSFEQAMYDLGGHSILLGQEIGLGKRESVEDVARVLEGMVDGIMARVFEHEKLEKMAAAAEVPVINALSDYSHPCQALADVMTLMDEFGQDVKGRKMVYVGDGNNVTRSLGLACAYLGVDFVSCSPAGYEIEDAFMTDLSAKFPEVNIIKVTDPKEAVKGADAIYTDTWVSMGQEEEKAKRLADFKGYELNEDLLGSAPDHAIVLHCLPAYRGIEITDGVMDGKQSRVFPQAHNRLHAQKGVLAVLMGGM